MFSFMEVMFMGDLARPAPVQQQNPHQFMCDSLVKAKQELDSKSPAEVLTNFKVAYLQMVLRFKEPAVLADLKSTYLSAVLRINNLNKTRAMRGLDDLIAVERGKIGAPPRQVPAQPREPSFTINAQDRQAIKNFERTLVTSFQRMAVNPTMFYGVSQEAGMPAWVNEIISAISNNSAIRNNMDSDVASAIENDPELAGKPGMKSILREAAKTSNGFNNVFSQLTLTQKAIDGISLIMKGKYGGVTVSEDDLRQFFGGLGLNDNQFNQLRALAGVTNGNADGQAVIQSIFDGLRGASRLPLPLCDKVISLVIDSNFGENAAGLNVLINDMGGTFVPRDSIKNLQSFYSCLMGAKGLGSAENRVAFQQLGSTLTDRLLNDRLYLGSATDAIHRDKYDISLLYAFAYSCKKSPEGYFKSPNFQRQSENFLNIIGGIGDTVLPPAIPLTIVQNYGTLNFIYENFAGNESGFYDIISTLANRVTSIYSRPFESNFNSVSTRFAAADKLVKGITGLQNNALLDDMLARFVDTSFNEDQNVIKIKNPFSLVLGGEQQQDWDNVRNFLGSMNIRSTDYFDTEGKYRSIQDFSRRQMPGIDMVNPQTARSNLLRKLPQTYLYGIDAIYGEIVRANEWFKPNEFGSAGNLLGNRSSTDVPNPEGGLSNEDTNINATGNAGFNIRGPVGGASTSWSSQTNMDRLYGRDYDSKANNGNGNATGTDVRDNRSRTEANNLQLGQAEITEAFLDWAERKGSQLEGQEISSTGYSNDLNFKLKGIAAGAGLVIMGERYFDDQGNEKLRLEAVINDGTKYIRFANLDKMADSGDPEFAKLYGKIQAHMKYVETCQWALPIGTFAAYENQNRSVPYGYPNPGAGTDKIPPVREGFIVGAGNVLGDHRLAGLTVQTVNGEILTLGSYGNFKTNSDAHPSVITAGYMLFRDNATDLFGRSATSTYGAGAGATPLPGSEFLSNNPIYVLSGMVDRFYGMALGNNQVGGFRVGGDNFSVGGIMRYDGGPRTYMANGQYFNSGFVSASVFTEKTEKAETTSGAVRFDLGNGYALKFYGLESTDAAQRINNLKTNPKAKALLQDISDLGVEIQRKIEDDTSDWNKDPSSRKSLLQSWTGQIIDQLNRANTFLPSEAVEDLRSQFAIGIEKSGEFETKLSIVRLGADNTATNLAGAGETAIATATTEPIYIVNMDRIKLGKSVLSFVAGVPVKMDDPYVGASGAASAGTGAVRNFAGLHLNVGRMTFGAAGYNLGSSDPLGIKYDVAYVNGDWATGVSSTLFGVDKRDKGGHRESVFLGNRKWNLSLGNTNARGLSSKDIAASVMLAANLNIGTYYRDTFKSVNVLKLKQAPGRESVYLQETGVNVGYTALDGTQFGSQFFLTRSRGGYHTSNLDGGIRLNFRFTW